MRDRHRTALQMRQEGATFQTIGDALGVSPSRANAIYQRAAVLRKEEVVGLRTRSMEVVRKCGNRLSEIAALAEVDPQGALIKLLKEPNCSRRDATDILAWLERANRSAT